MRKVLLLGSQHGNEKLGDALYAHLSTKRRELLPHITYIIGNPRAYAENIRYIESDLNRSYNGKRNTYEERRALKLLNFIGDGMFELVIDLHTTKCLQPTFMMVASDSEEIERFKHATSIKRVVYMKHHIKKTSLIGVCPNAISIEVNEHSLDIKLLGALCDDIERYIIGVSSLVTPQMYEIYDLLGKEELPQSDIKVLQNFKKTTYGFYPILVGDNSYKKQTDYLGFKARIIETKSLKGTV
jgi:hypothetical protein